MNSEATSEGLSDLPDLTELPLVALAAVDADDTALGRAINRVRRELEELQDATAGYISAVYRHSPDP